MESVKNVIIIFYPIVKFVFKINDMKHTCEPKVIKVYLKTQILKYSMGFIYFHELNQTFLLTKNAPTAINTLEIK
jgi:hypothetical protein